MSSINSGTNFARYLFCNTGEIMYSSSSSSSSHPLPHISSEDWGVILSDVAQSQREQAKSLGPRKYIYINDDQQVAVFTSAKAAKKGGFYHKLSLQEIITITNGLMDQITDENVKVAASESLRSMAFYKVSAREKGPIAQLFSRFSSTSLSLKDSFEVGKDISSPSYALINPSKLDEIHELVNSAIAITRSRSGDKGVYFFLTKNGKRTGIKIEKTPIKQILADRFFQKFGFTTPKYCAFDKSTEQGMSIFDQLNSFGSNYFDQQLNSSSSSSSSSSPPPVSMDTVKSQKKTFTRDLQSCKFLMGMEYLYATPFSDRSAVQMLNDLRDPVFLHNLGEVMFLDAIIHNTDRMHPFSCNFGNMMRISDEDIGLGEKKIALLDHDYKLSGENLPSCEEQIEDLLLGNRAELTLRKFISQLGEGVSNSFSDEDLTSTMLPHVKEGVRFAAAQFVTEFSNKGAVLELLDIPHLDNVSLPSYLVLQALVKLTGKLLKM